MARTLDPEKHDEKRREILTAAGRCFAREGFRGARTSQICVEAKISPGHLFHYFKDKEAIVLAMIESHLNFAERRFLEMMKTETPITFLLDAIEQKALKGCQPDQLLLLELMAEAGRNQAIGEAVRLHSRRLQSLLSVFLRDAQEKGQVDPELDIPVASTALLSIIDGSTTLSIRNDAEDAANAAEVLKAAIRRFLAR